MKIGVINDLLTSVNLAPLNRNQLLSLAGSDAGKSFGTALRQLEAGNRAAVRTLSLVVRAHSPNTQAHLHEIGFKCSETELARLAIQEGESLFTVLTKTTANANERRLNVAYLAGLGLARGPHPTATPVPAGPAVPPYYSFKVFGRSAALTISEAMTRKTNEYTVQFDGARGLTAMGKTTYDWQNKLIFQLSTSEMYQLLALLERKLENLQLNGHGSAHDKFMHFKVQDGDFFFRMGQTGRFALALPIIPSDAIRIQSLLYRQIGANDAHLSISDIQHMISNMASMMSRHN